MTVFCAAVDWGTTSFRLWLLARDGTVLGESRGEDGILSTGPDEYADKLARHLSAAGASSACRVVICGMAGARQGWVEAPYVDTPADLSALCGGATHVRAPEHDVRLLPGVAQRINSRPDVMRGEETQLLGLGLRDALVCMPGTHSKWVSLSGGRLDAFSTHMTGELYSVLAEHSILRHSTTYPDFDADNPVFREAVEHALQSEGAMSGILFSVRARGLVGDDDGQGAACLSGLLIGAELAAARSNFGQHNQVTLLSSGRLGTLYLAALQLAGMKVVQEDAEAAVIRGLLRAAKEIWGQS